MSEFLKSRITYRSVQFSDVDEFAMAVSDADCNHMPLTDGAFDGFINQLRVGDFSLQRAFVPPHINRGVVQPDRYGLFLPLGDATGLVVNGHRFANSEGLMLGGSADIDLVCPQTQAWASIACGAAEFEALMEATGMDAPLAGLDRLVGTASGGIMALGRAIGALADLVDSMPSVFHAADLERSLTESLRDMLTRTLADMDCRAEPPRLTRDMRRLVNSADAYMREHVARPVYTEELCNALGVSPRKLHNAFTSMYGMSPHNYLKRRRLMLVHRALRTDASDRHLVKSVALAHGFWHLGNFAHDYRALFGRMPSDTRRATAQAGDLPGMASGLDQNPMDEVRDITGT